MNGIPNGLEKCTQRGKKSVSCCKEAMLRMDTWHLSVILLWQGTIALQSVIITFVRSTQLQCRNGANHCADTWWNMRSVHLIKRTLCIVTGIENKTKHGNTPSYVVRLQLVIWFDFMIFDQPYSGVGALRQNTARYTMRMGAIVRNTVSTCSSEQIIELIHRIEIIGTTKASWLWSQIIICYYACFSSKTTTKTPAAIIRSCVIRYFRI